MHYLFCALNHVLFVMLRTRQNILVLSHLFIVFSFLRTPMCIASAHICLGICKIVEYAYDSVAW